MTGMLSLFILTGSILTLVGHVGMFFLMVFVPNPFPIEYVWSATAIYLTTFGLCVYHMNSSNRVRESKIGLAISMVFFGPVLFPIYWYRHVRRVTEVT